jgi:hypothetical protein
MSAAGCRRASSQQPNPWNRGVHGLTVAVHSPREYYGPVKRPASRSRLGVPSTA